MPLVHEERKGGLCGGQTSEHVGDAVLFCKDLVEAQRSTEFAALGSERGPRPAYLQKWYTILHGSDR
eukprot:2400163-Pyramimonas_sp.AAC.1